MGGGGGYSDSETNSEPWARVQPLLVKLLDTAMGGAYNKQSTPEGTTEDASQNTLDMFMGKDSVGKLDYFGDQNVQNNLENRWESQANLNFANPYYADKTLQQDWTPTLAGFSPEQNISQGIINERAKGKDTYRDPDTGYEYKTGYSPLIGNSKTALDRILTGANKIDPATMNAASVGNIDTITKPGVAIPDSMETPEIGSTDLGYKYWDELGQVAGNKSNPYLEQMISAAKDSMQNEYENYQVPSLDNTAEKAGAYGSGQWGKIRNDAFDTYLKNAGQVESSMRGNAYETNMNRALQGMTLGGDLAKSQSGMDSERNMQQALLESNRRSTEYGTGAEAERLKSQLGLQADTTNVGNMLEKALQNAQFQQGSNDANARYKQEANIGNVQNILNSVGQAGQVGQADYNDISNLAAVGEEKTNQWQKVLDSYRTRQETKQMEPWNRAGMVSNLASGNWGGTTTSSGKSGK